MRHPEHNDQWQKLTRQHRIAPPLAPAPIGVSIKASTLRNLTVLMKPAIDLSTKPILSSPTDSASPHRTPPVTTRPAMFLGSKATGELRILMRLAAGVSASDATPRSNSKIAPERSF
jgi:hypothetical protein